MSPNDVVRLKAPLEIPAGAKGRVCGVTRDGRDRPVLVAIWVRLADNELEKADDGE